MHTGVGAEVPFQTPAQGHLPLTESKVCRVRSSAGKNLRCSADPAGSALMCIQEGLALKASRGLS